MIPTAENNEQSDKADELIRLPKAVNEDIPNPAAVAINTTDSKECFENYVANEPFVVLAREVPAVRIVVCSC